MTSLISPQGSIKYQSISIYLSYQVFAGSFDKTVALAFNVAAFDQFIPVVM